MAVICVGPLCIPLWPIFAIAIKPIWDNFVPTQVKRSLRNAWSLARNLLCPRRTGKPDTIPKNSMTGKSTNVKSIDTQEDYHAMLVDSKDIPSVVKFTADFCAPCRLVESKYKALATRFQALVSFYTIDVEKNEELAIALGVSSIPTFFLFVGGATKKEFRGVNLENLTESLETAVCESGKSKRSKVK